MWNEPFFLFKWIADVFWDLEGWVPIEVVGSEG